MSIPKIFSENSQLDLLAFDDARLATQARLEKILQRHELSKTWPMGKTESLNLDAVGYGLDTEGDPRLSEHQRDSQVTVYNDGDIFRGRPGNMRRIP